MMMVYLKLTPLEWALERLENCKRIAASKTGADRDGWIEDAAYWEVIIDHLRRVYH